MRGTARLSGEPVFAALARLDVNAHLAERPRAGSEHVMEVGEVAVEEIFEAPTHGHGVTFS